MYFVLEDCYLKIGVKSEDVVLSVGHHASLLIFADLLLEEIRFALERDELHEREGIFGVVDLVDSKLIQQAIGDELDVLGHQLAVHSKHACRKSVGEEFLLDFDSFGDDFDDALLWWLLQQMLEHETSEVTVKTFVARYQLVGESQAWHETAFLQPEDRRETSTEEDSFDGSEGDDSLSEVGVLAGDPVHSPIGLLLDARHVLNGVKQEVALV